MQTEIEFFNRVYNESYEKSTDLISNYKKVPNASITQVQNQCALPGNCPWNSEFNKENSYIVQVKLFKKEERGFLII